jgi:hypothetical protein
VARAKSCELLYAPWTCQRRRTRVLPPARRRREATQLHKLSLSHAAIARHLGADDKTVAKAIRLPCEESEGDEPGLP